MQVSTLAIRIGTILFLLLAVLFSVAVNLSPFSISAAVFKAASEPLLTVTFLDVGQGDAIYIETPDGVQVLIDGGPDSGVLRELSKQLPLFDTDLDVVIATHSDKDHVGGLIEVFERFAVDTIVRTKNQNDTEVAQLFDTFVGTEGAEILYARAGQQLQLGASTTLLILSPEGDSSQWESNTASIIAQLQYGEATFMLTGDAPLNIEEYLVTTHGPLLQSDVLKLGHHGSRTSSGDLFLDSVSPEYGVVSAGKDNSYGHPHTEVVQALTERGIVMLETATQGNIVFKSDGQDVWLVE